MDFIPVPTSTDNDADARKKFLADKSIRVENDEVVSDYSFYVDGSEGKKLIGDYWEPGLDATLNRRYYFSKGDVGEKDNLYYQKKTNVTGGKRKRTFTKTNRRKSKTGKRRNKRN